MRFEARRRKSGARDTNAALERSGNWSSDWGNESNLLNPPTRHER